MKLLLILSAFVAFSGAMSFTQTSPTDGMMWVRRSMGKSWKVRRVENIDNCCRTCGKKGAARNKPDLVAFHYQQRKRTCACFSSHPKRRGFQAGKCLREEEPISTELPSTSFPSTSSSL